MRALSILLVTGMFCVGSAARGEVGVTDTEIKLGGHSILSGQFASYSSCNFAAKAYFDQVNKQGGVNGRKINYVIEDNAFSPRGTIEAVRKLIQREKVFALFLNLGVTHLAAYKLAQQAKVPDMMISDNSMEYGNPVNPYTYTILAPVVTEGEALGQLLVKKFAGKKIGILVPNTPTGYDMMEALKKVVGDKVVFGPEETAPWDAVDANAQVSNLIAAKVDVIVAFSAPPVTPNAMKFAVQKGFKGQWILNDYNADLETLTIAGKAAEGAIVVNNLSNDMSQKWFVDHVAMMKKAYPNQVPSSYTVFGQLAAELMVDMLKKAGKDLTRDSLIKSAETIKDWKHPMLRSPINISKDNHAAVRDALFAIAKDGKWVDYKF